MGVEARRGLGSLFESTHGRTGQAMWIEPIPLFSDEVYVHIPMCLRQHIWRGEYINLALLLKGAVELSRYCCPNTLRVTATGTLEAGPRICK